MCSLDPAMSPKISIICENERQEIGHSVTEKLEHIGFVTEIQWQEDEGLKTSFYNAAAVVACVSTTNSNSLHLVSEIERAAYVQIPIIAVLIDQDFDPNDQGWVSIIQMIKVRAVVDFNQDNEFECYFEELYKQWTRNVPEKERVEKGTDVKDEDFEGDEKEPDDKEGNEDKEENWNDGKEVDEDDSLNQNENEDESNNEREVEKEDVTTVNASGEDEHQKDDEDIEKGQKEGEETEEVDTKEPEDENQKDTEEEEVKNTYASNTEDTFPSEDIAADGSTAPNDEIGSKDDTPKEETIPPSEATEHETVPGEDTTHEGGFATEDDIVHEEGTTGDKADGDVPEEDATPVEQTEQDATTGWQNAGNENFTHFNSDTEFQESGKGFIQNESEEKLKGEGEPFFGEQAAA